MRWDVVKRWRLHNLVHYWLAVLWLFSSSSRQQQQQQKSQPARYKVRRDKSIRRLKWNRLSQHLEINVQARVFLPYRLNAMHASMITWREEVEKTHHRVTSNACRSVGNISLYPQRILIDWNSRPVPTSHFLPPSSSSFRCLLMRNRAIYSVTLHCSIRDVFAIPLTRERERENVGIIGQCG